jgi:glycolate oxidase iron-sulfur subunit
VKYGRLVDIGRKVVEQRVQRPLGERISARYWWRADAQGGVWRGAEAGQIFRPLLSPALQDKCRAPGRRRVAGAQHARKMLVLDGCAAGDGAQHQRRHGARARCAGRAADGGAQAGCCGALRHHLNEQEAALDDMRRNIDVVALRAATVEAIVMTASGCGATVKEYGHLLAHDSAMPEGAAHFGADARPERVMPQFEPLALRRRLNGPRGLPPALHAAARPADPRQGRSVLRAVGVDVVLCRTAICAAARPAAIRCCSRNSRCNCATASWPVWPTRARKPLSRPMSAARASAIRHGNARHALDRTDRRALKQGQLRGVAISLAMQA